MADDTPPLPRFAPPRAYRWTLARQRAFLEVLADTGAVTEAAQHVGISPRAAYDLRRRGDGTLFALGWHAAVLIARHRLTDALLERALLGQEDVSVRLRDPDAERIEVRRQRRDNRLGLTMLARLDRMAEGAAATAPAADDYWLARHVAQHFDAFLDAMAPPPGHDAEADATADADAAESLPDDALDMADRTAMAYGDAMLDVSALLADAIGRAHPLLRLHAKARIHCEVAEESALPDAVEAEARAHAATLSVWRDGATGAYQTSFPPPPDFAGASNGHHVHGPGYARDLTDYEAAVVAARIDRVSDTFAAASAAARDCWFADPDPASRAAGALPPLPEWRAAPPPPPPPPPPPVVAAPVARPGKPWEQPRPRETLDELIERIRRHNAKTAARELAEAEGREWDPVRFDAEYADADV